MVLEDSTAWGIIFLSTLAFVAYKMYHHARGDHSQRNPARRTREENMEALKEIFPIHSYHILQDALDRTDGSVSLATQYLLENDIHVTKTPTRAESDSHFKSSLPSDISGIKWSPNAEERQKMLFSRKRDAIEKARR